MAQISFADKPKAAVGSRITIDPEFAAELEQVYAFLVENPGKVGYVKEDDAKALNRWFHLARIYLGRRDGGELQIRKLPNTIGHPDNEAYFTIRPAALEPTPQTSA